MSPRILIVDDNPFVRVCLTRLLRSHTDWQVCGEAADGEEAVRRTQQLNPDLVVLDFRMPKMNGIDAARRIRQVSPETAIVLCTLCFSKELAEMARQAGVARTLSKSDLNRIVPCIEEILRRKNFSPSTRMLG